MNKQCVNCPGSTDHTTAECPVMVEASAPIDPIHSAMMLGMTPEPCEPIIEITRLAVTKLLDVVEFGDQLERVEKDRLVAFVKDLLAEPQPELWAMHSVGPNEVHPMISKEEAERQAASLIALCKERFPDIPITVNVIPSPYSPLEHFEILAEELTEQVASLRKALDKKKAESPAPAVAMPPEISRDLLGKIVDEVFDGAIEDPSVIEDIYRVIAREQPSTAASRDVLAERHRQVNVEGFHGIRDSHYVNYELSKAARAYIEVSWHALSTGIPCAKPKSWPWMDGFKWSDGRTMLVKAGALILAEIERLDRAEQAKRQELQP